MHGFENGTKTFFDIVLPVLLRLTVQGAKALNTDCHYAQIVEKKYSVYLSETRVTGKTSASGLVNDLSTTWFLLFNVMMKCYRIAVFNVDRNGNPEQVLVSSLFHF